jgi:hypothetical protein
MVARAALNSVGVLGSEAFAGWPESAREGTAVAARVVGPAGFDSTGAGRAGRQTKGAWVV